MYYEVIPEGKVGALTYAHDGSLLPGQVVLVPLGRRSVPGVVVKKVAQPDFRTKKILQLLYAKPLPRHLLDVVEFVHEYYLVPLGVAIGLVLPGGVEKQRRKRKNEQMFGIDSDGSVGGSRLEKATGPVALSSPKIFASQNILGGPPPSAPPVAGAEHARNRTSSRLFRNSTEWCPEKCAKSPPGGS